MSPADDLRRARTRQNGDEERDLVAEDGTPPNRSAGNPRPPRLLLTIPEAAESLAIGTTAIYDLIAGGQLASVKIGRSRRIAAATLADFVEQLKGEGD